MMIWPVAVDLINMLQLVQVDDGNSVLAQLILLPQGMRIIDGSLIVIIPFNSPRSECM